MYMSSMIWFNQKVDSKNKNKKQTRKPRNMAQTN